MESVLLAEPEPIQRMFEDARFLLPFKAPLAQQFIRHSEELLRIRRFLLLQRLTALRKGAETSSGA
jgi:hypothetical protein